MNTCVIKSASELSLQSKP